MTQTYVLKGKEVFLTGRTAIKESRRGKSKILYETKSISCPTCDPVWVDMSELFEVVKGDESEEQ